MNATLGKIELFFKDNGRRIELFLFRLVMWTVVVCCFIGLLTKAVLGKPGSVPVHYLLFAITIAASLAVLLPTVLSRISAVTFGGVTLVLATTETALDDFRAAFDDLPASGVAFETNKLEGPQRYEYERLSHRLYRISDRLKDPDALDLVNRDRYRRLIDYVARAAFKQNHLTKYLEVVKNLESFADRAPTSDELYLIGHAYLCAAEEQLGESKKNSYWKSAVEWLEAASKKNSNDVNIRFNLGLAQLKLGYFQPAIDSMKACVEMYPPIVPQARWNWAEGLKKLKRNADALTKLDEIPPGAFWKDILADEAFKDPEDPGFESEFKTLCERKINQSKP